MVKQPAKRPAKEVNLLTKVRTAITSGDFADVDHAQIRQAERKITRPEYLYVLTKSGWHEKRKDTFIEAFKAWNYAIRGKTIDERELRVIVSFDEDGLLIITVIDLEVT
ncbi:MAG: DUF4258 domain-containing protein [Candidatus Sericytochromatia bacterium]|nr:DUF4258 domain-containing protein [Candidatus Sericytochromatia bacterium]